MTQDKKPLDIRSIFEMLPHRYPFLLIDKVKEYVPGEYVEVIKNVTFNEPFFQGHFPGLPVMPGVLILEAMAQAAGVYIMQTHGDIFQGKVFVYSGVDKVRFRRPVVPGDQLVLRASNIRKKMNIFKMDGTATVDGQLACQAEMMAALVDKESF